MGWVGEACNHVQNSLPLYTRDFFCRYGPLPHPLAAANRWPCRGPIFLACSDTRFATRLTGSELRSLGSTGDVSAETERWRL